MITHIEIEGFKSFERVSLDLGHLNIFVGTNASGKSNFFDALRVLQGIGYGFTIDEIFNGKPRSATTGVWEGIRGGIAHAGFLDCGLSRGPKRIARRVRFSVTLTDPELEGELTYVIEIDPARSVVFAEGLNLGRELVFHSNSERPQPWLYQVPGSRQYSQWADEKAEICLRLLRDAQFLDPSPALLRDYSTLPAARRMGDAGEDFAGLVASIMVDDESGPNYLAWLKELTPAEFDEIGTLQGALNEPLFAVTKNGAWVPAPMLSDGTLRFAALAAAFFQPDMPERIMIEEIENGFHPTRLRLLLELLRSQSASGRPQVMATSHSPLVLAWLTEEDFKTTFLCQKDEETGASTITPLTSIPRFLELAREQSAADLFAEGWLENAI